MRVHSVLKQSNANGPATRYVIWVQGCTLQCPGCFNPETHPKSEGRAVKPSDLYNDIVSMKDDIAGITISGGEPFQQPYALFSLLSLVRMNTSLSVVLFSGHTLDELLAKPIHKKILSLSDVLIAGRYVASRHTGFGLLGSANQKIHFLSPRYSPKDFTDIPDTEIIIDAAGKITVTGIAPAVSGIQ